MLYHGSRIFPSLPRNSRLLSLFSKIPLPLTDLRNHHHFHSVSDQTRRRSFSSLAAAVEEPIPKLSTSKASRKARRESPEGVLRHRLDMCSRHGDVAGALRLYDEARVKAVPLTPHHYNALLYLCSQDGSSEAIVRRGFEILHQMLVVDKVEPNEATFTNAARLAAAAEDHEKAFDLVKQMRSFGIPPKLRSYAPALFGFCGKLDALRAYEVDAHMAECGVMAEEDELAALMEVSVGTGNATKVYEMLHRIRKAVRQVSERTASVAERWFGSEAAGRVGAESWDAGRMRAVAASRGGGWHGQGWLGSGEWEVARTRMDENGVCQCCNERLVCIDIDLKETANFATSLASLAAEKEARANFVHFQEWLKRHGPFDAVVDGANMGLVNQREFNLFQVKSVVHKLRKISPSKRMPLVILHQKRVHRGPAQNPMNMQLLESWRKSGSLYATPAGSNDDWYWLYAAVSNNCLIVTNDEMRDHLFQLLGTSFFPRWKEKHQVRLSRNGLKLHMPPPYSIVIQESEDGRWHIPTVTGDDLEAPRQWLCAARAKNTKIDTE